MLQMTPLTRDSARSVRPTWGNVSAHAEEYPANVHLRSRSKQRRHAYSDPADHLIVRLAAFSTNVQPPHCSVFAAHDTAT
jgi:hypothetical protein